MDLLPTNPTEGDGEIIEVFPNVFYQYSENQHSWIRLNGYKSIKPATSISSGLMTKEDYQKINELLTVPPKTNLTSDKCNVTFDGGTIKLYSRDSSVFIEDYLDLYETNATHREQWHIHEDTWGFNFRINLHYLVEEMKRRGNLISETVVGPKGPTGERGEPGINKLDTGPKGPDGLPGANAPFAGSLVNNSNFIISDKSKAVIDVKVEEISPEENYLTVYKGTISPKNLCVNKVKVQNVQSTWLLVRKEQGLLCTLGCKTSCETVFVDVEVIIDSIRNHFNAMILKAKQEKEALVKEWLKTMMYTFNDQKHALCCALENCISKKRNQAERRYIETQRTTAAAADFKILISDEKDDNNTPEPHTKVEVDMDKYKSCGTPAPTLNWVPTIVIPNRDSDNIG